MIEFLSACLRGPAPAWPEGLSTERFLEEAALHGVQGLLQEELHRGSSLAREMPAEVAELLSRWTRHEAAHELVRRERIAELLRSLAARAVPGVLLKGAALAYGLYRHPHLRPRADTDLLVPESSRTEARDVLTALGYVFPNAVSGEFISSQISANLTDRHGMTHCVDLHWRLNNAQGFARVLEFEGLLERAVPLPALAPEARGPSLVDSLLIACLNRIGHRHARYWFGGRRHLGDRLIWLYDIHLLALALTPEAWRDVSARATATGLRAVCRDALLRTRELLGTEIPVTALQDLEHGGDEIPAGYLEGNRLQWFFTDLRALPGWSSRLRLLSEHVFPPADYILKRYGRRSRLWLPALYLQRGLRGAWRLLRR